MNRYILFLALSSLFFLNSCGKKEEGQKVVPVTKSNPSDTPLDKVIGLAYIEPVNRLITLNAKTNGLVKTLFVEVNQPLLKDQPILAMDSAVEQAQMAQAQSKIATQQAQIQTQQKTVDAFKIRLENARVNYERNLKLFAGQALTQQVLDDSRYTFENLQKEVMVSEATTTQLQKRIDEIKTDIAFYQTMIDQKIVKAPANGMMLSLESKIGTSIRSETAIGDFAPDGALMAVTEVDELFADRVKIGQSAYIRIQGTTDKVVSGKIIYTSPYLKKKSLFSDSASNLEDRRVREVRVELESGSKVLIGSRMECVIELK